MSIDGTDEMFVWVMYDIAANDLRLKIAEVCKDHGLVRFQKSVFFGEITRKRMLQLGDALHSQVNGHPTEEKTEDDSILVFQLCDTCLRDKVVIGKDFDEEMYRKRPYMIL